MKEYSNQFLEAIKHPRIQGMVRKRGDKRVVNYSDDNPTAFFVPEVYNLKNPYRSLIGMLGTSYIIHKYKFNGRTYYDITFSRKIKNSKLELDKTVTGTDFQLTLLRAVIFKKTGQIWQPSKKCWSKKIYND